MNYEKLTVDRFSDNLKTQKYQGITGARRAIGKTNWSQKDKDKAHALANTYFGEEGTPKVAAKKVAAAGSAGSKEKEPKVPAKKAAKKAGSAWAKASSALPATKKAPTKAAKHATFEADTKAVTSTAGEGKSLTRLEAAAHIAGSGMRVGLGRLSPEERFAYYTALAEYCANAAVGTEELFKSAALAKSHDERKTPEVGSVVVASPGRPQRIAPPEEAEEVKPLTPAQQKALEDAAAIALSPSLPPAAPGKSLLGGLGPNALLRPHA